MGEMYYTSLPFGGDRIRTDFFMIESNQSFTSLGIFLNTQNSLIVSTQKLSTKNYQFLPV